MGLKDKLRQRLKGTLPDKLLPLLPGRYPIIGSAVLLRLKGELLPFGRTIGKALVEINHQIKSAWTFTGGTKGIRRIPQVQWLAGSKNPVVLHKEHGTRFAIDISHITFSPGNSGERGRLVRMVKPEQVLVDLFACCGNLSLPAATNNRIKEIWMMEINPHAYHYLIENLYLNGLEKKAIPILGDNHHFRARNIGDHVFLGILPRPDEVQLENGIRALKNDGGWLHYHTSVKKREGARKKARDEVIKKAESMDREVEKVIVKKIKGLSATLQHVVIRAFLLN